MAGLLSLAACTTPQSSSTQVGSLDREKTKVTPEGETLTCEMEQVAGSLRRVEVCQTLEERELVLDGAGVHTVMHQYRGAGRNGIVEPSKGKRFE